MEKELDKRKMFRARWVGIKRNSIKAMCFTLKSTGFLFLINTMVDLTENICQHLKKKIRERENILINNCKRQKSIKCQEPEP